MMRDPTLKRWWTLQERSLDERTGALVEVSQDDGKQWVWRVYHTTNSRGHASSRKSARAAARSYVRSLPSVASKPDRQLPLFKQEKNNK